MSAGRLALAGALGACALAAGVVAAPGAARALDFKLGDTPVYLDLTESLILDWNSFLDDPQIVADADKENIVDLRNRLNVRLRADWLTFGMRLDVAWFPNPPANPGQASQYRDDVRPEELFLTARLGDLTLTLGDDYLSFGRGLALSLRKFDELGFATSLRGVHAQWRGDWLKARVSAGLTNVVNVDTVEQKLVPDPNDLIVAARVEATPFEGLGVGVHAVDVERRHSDARDAIAGTLTGDDDTGPINSTRFLRSTVVGGNVELPSLAGGKLSIYAETDWLFGSEERVTASGNKAQDTDGFALYGQVQAFLEPLTILAEFKHYVRFELESTLHPDTASVQGITQQFSYIVPPTLERIDQRIAQNSDVTGGHLRVDYAVPGTGDSFFLSGAFFVDAPAANDTTLHVYGGFEHTGERGNRLLMQAGYRREEAPDDDLIRLRMIHFDLDVFQVLNEWADLQLHWSHEFRDTNIGAPSLQDTYIEGTSYVSLNLPPRWSLTAQVEYRTDVTTDDPLFLGGFVQYFFTPASFVRVFAGRSKGGLKCSGGVCRIFPNFEGVRLETTLRF
ncbi:MAG: hypothetical protein KC635_00085 [Myxococcales bacterium]|nr:hypothetical protein [Myxococcales bacterium]MCB9734917.1 hypothetical protein [Deltaproteobacteria bacterium]